MASIYAFCVFVITIGIQAVAAERFNGSLYYHAPTVQSSAGGCPSDVVREGTLSSIRQDVAAHLRNLTRNVIYIITLLEGLLHRSSLGRAWGSLPLQPTTILKVAIVAGYVIDRGSPPWLVEWYMYSSETRASPAWCQRLIQCIRLPSCINLGTVYPLSDVVRVRCIVFSRSEWLLVRQVSGAMVN